MAKDREPPKTRKPDRNKPVTSDELIKRAWNDIGRADPDAAKDRPHSSTSSAMTSSANAASTASSEARTLAAEEIARLLREDEQGRRSPGPPVEQSPVEQPRPRRLAPGELPPPPVRQPRRAPPSRKSRPSRQLPAPRVPASERARPGQAPPVRVSGRRATWLVFLMLAALSSIFGRVSGDTNEANDDSPTPTAFTLEDYTLLTDKAALQPGMCILRLLPSGSDPVETVPCDEPHRYEVFAIVDSAGPTIAAGRDEQECRAEFLPYVGERDVTSPFDLIVVSPTESEWVEDGERVAICLLYLAEGSQRIFWEGSARDSGLQ